MPHRIRKPFIAHAVRALVLGAALAAVAPAHAQVVVNGQPVTGAELYQLQLLVGEPIPAGRYWLDVSSGAWGYEGNPQVQGNIYAEDGGQQQAPQYDSYYDGQGGSYASDGRCAYFSIPGMSASTCD